MDGRRHVQNWIGLLALLGGAIVSAQAPPHLPPLDRALPPRVEQVYAAVAPRVDGESAMAIVRTMGPLWRLAGNPAYEQSIAAIRRRLDAAGFATRIDEYPNDGKGWEPRLGTLSLAGEGGDPVLSMARDRVPLAINSFSTPPGGIDAPLVDVGRGAAAGDYEGKDVAGAVVLASGPIGPAWQQAVRSRGALGVISSDIAGYTRPESTPDVLQWGSIPYDEARRSFGFKATPRAAARLRAAVARGGARVHVEVDTAFHPGPNRTLVAEIPGRGRPDDRVVLVAHVQEPGANDNASGCGTLLAAAMALQGAIASGALPPPERTLTFLWGDEIRASEQWVRADEGRVSRVLAMLSLDMTGEDTAKTGGTFLIEKGPDPSAVWPSPSDPHTEWGASKVDPAMVHGSFLNDLHLAVSLRRARDTGWTVRTNPYEGGSDHTVFTRAGVPALLNWHFTDRYYHTNLDTVDKTSAAEMANVGAAVATTAMFLASAGAGDVAPMRRLMAEAREARLATETRNGAAAEVMDAWRRWYDEATASVERLR